MNFLDLFGNDVCDSLLSGIKKKVSGLTLSGPGIVVSHEKRGVWHCCGVIL